MGLCDHSLYRSAVELKFGKEQPEDDDLIGACHPKNLMLEWETAYAVSQEPKHCLMIEDEDVT